MVLNVFDWARERGGRVSDSIAVGMTSYGGKGMFAVRDIPAKEELIYLPSHLQLGVGQLAEGNDTELQDFTRSLPWHDIVNNGITFLPCAISICAEMRNPQSIFTDYLQSISSTNYTGAMAPWEKDDPPSFLSSASPLTADKIFSKRKTLRLIHSQLAPTSLTFHSLSWASAVVTSRAFSRKHPPPFKAGRIGNIAAVDSTRFLPVIDLVNHGGRQGGSNVLVRHVAKGEREDDDPHSTSLTATRPIAAGDELLLDYGGGRPLANEHLLLEYGFILRDHAEDTVLLRFQEDFLPAVKTFDEKRIGMQDVGEVELQAIRSLIQSIAKSDGAKLHKSPVVFGPNGRPALHTMALVLVLSCRGKEDVGRVLAAVQEFQDQDTTNVDKEGGSGVGNLSSSEFEKLLVRILNVTVREHKELAFAILRVAARSVLEEIEASSSEIDDNNGFDSVAREYLNVRCDILQRAALMDT